MQVGWLAPFCFTPIKCVHWVWVPYPWSAKKASIWNQAWTTMKLILNHRRPLGGEWLPQTGVSLAFRAARLNRCGLESSLHNFTISISVHNHNLALLKWFVSGVLTLPVENYCWHTNIQTNARSFVLCTCKRISSFTKLPKGSLSPQIRMIFLKLFSPNIQIQIGPKNKSP